MKPKIYSIALFFLLSLFIGCSSENNETENQNVSTLRLGSQNEVETAKRLFLEMMNTNEYITYRNELRSFVTKLNGKILPQFRDKSEASNWIVQNLTSTNFISTQEFNTMIDSMEEKYRIVIQRNQQVFALMQLADETQLFEIIQPSLGTLPVLTVNSGCANGCMDSASSSIDNLDIMYASSIVTYSTLVPEFHQYIRPLLDASYWSNFQGIVDNLNSCLAGC